jgi:hypothetical protein
MKCTTDFDTLRPMLHSIARYQLAATTAEWVAGQYATGKHKLAALEFAVQTATKWFEQAQQQPDAEEAAEEAKQARARLEKTAADVFCELQLYRCEVLFGEQVKQLLPLIQKPSELVCQLYHKFGGVAKAKEQQLGLRGSGRGRGSSNNSSMNSSGSSFGSLSLSSVSPSSADATMMSTAGMVCRVHVVGLI